MSARMRLVGWNVQPVVMADDGENLTPLPVNPLQIPAAQWEAFKAGGDAQALDQLRAQVEGPESDKPRCTRTAACAAGTGVCEDCVVVS